MMMIDDDDLLIMKISKKDYGYIIGRNVRLGI
jgi:hypothetical protein